MEKLAKEIRRHYSTVQAVYRRGRGGIHRVCLLREYLRGLVDAMRICYGYRSFFDSQRDTVEFVAVESL